MTPDERQAFLAKNEAAVEQMLLLAQAAREGSEKEETLRGPAALALLEVASFAAGEERDRLHDLARRVRDGRYVVSENPARLSKVRGRVVAPGAELDGGRVDLRRVVTFLAGLGPGDAPAVQEQGQEAGASPAPGAAGTPVDELLGRAERALAELQAVVEELRAAARGA